jgi:hypothetical protein
MISIHHSYLADYVDIYGADAHSRLEQATESLVMLALGYSVQLQGFGVRERREYRGFIQRLTARYRAAGRFVFDARRDS